MTSQTDKDLHSIALTLRDILKELKRFNTNYERIHSAQRGPRLILDDEGNTVREVKVRGTYMENLEVGH